MILILGYLAPREIVDSYIVFGESDDESVVGMRIELYNLQKRAIVGAHNFPHLIIPKPYKTVKCGWEETQAVVFKLHVLYCGGVTNIGLHEVSIRHQPDFSLPLEASTQHQVPSIWG